jgi:hypothetical protein
LVLMLLVKGGQALPVRLHRFIQQIEMVATKTGGPTAAPCALNGPV